jgi:hypothetical protein
MIAGAIQDKIEEAAARQAVGQQPPALPPMQEPIVQVPGQQPPAPPATPHEPPKSVVSTEPVSQLDIAAMFKTPTTEAPPPPAQLPPDTPVEAPPEIEHNERAKSAWEILRNRERESRHLAESLKSQLEQTSKQAGAVAEERAKFADELKSRDDRIHELEDELGKLSLEHKPEFRHQYDEPMEKIAQSFRDALMDAAEIDDEDTLAETAKKLLSMNDSEFNRMVAQLPATAQGSLWDKRREYIGIATARSNAISEWRTAQAGVAATDAQRQVIQNTERRRTLAEQAIDFTNTQLTQDKRPSVLSEATYKADVDSANQQFRGFMQVASDDELARVAYQGFLVPVMQRQVAFLAEALGKWRDAYYAIRGAGAPPALPMRVQTQTPDEPPAPIAPKVTEGSGSFSNTVRDTIADGIRGAMIR